MANIAINGFGRIGRQAFKAGYGKKGFDVVAINDLGDAETLAYLLKYDTNYGMWDHEVSHKEHAIVVDGKEIPVYAERNPEEIPWGDHSVDIVIESTGVFREKEAAKAHVKAGAKRVIISAPGKSEMPTYVKGVNEQDGSDDDTVVSNASCTTNCASPVLSVLDEAFGVEKAMLNTVHGYTASQNLVDGNHKDLRRGRAAAENMIPTTTGAAKATMKVMPQLDGKFDGLAIRVPLSTMSLTDITALLSKDATVEDINEAFKKAANSPRFKGVLRVNEEPIVSSDLVGDPYSAIVDAEMTRVVGGNMVKILAWYDNEWGYANRLAEMAVFFGQAA